MGVWTEEILTMAFVSALLAIVLKLLGVDLGF